MRLPLKTKKEPKYPTFSMCPSTDLMNFKLKTH